MNNDDLVGCFAFIVSGIIFSLLGFGAYSSYQKNERDYIITCTSLLPNSEPVVYKCDTYFYPSRSDPNWNFVLLNGDVINLIPYTTDVKIQEVPEGSLIEK